MTLGKINHLQFYVEDLQETRRYFTEKLGFKFVRRGHGGRSVDLAPYEGGPTFEFFQITEEYKTAKAEERPDLTHVASDRRPYLDHIAFEVEAMDKAYGELRSKGVIFQEAPELNPSNDRMLAGTCDAEGKRWIQLLEVKPD